MERNMENVMEPGEFRDFKERTSSYQNGCLGIHMVWGFKYLS